MSFSTTSRTLRAVAATALLSALPRAALACPGCVAQKDGNDGYMAATLLLGLLPLTLLGVSLFFLHRALRERDDPREEASAPPIGGAGQEA